MEHKTLGWEAVVGIGAGIVALFLAVIVLKSSLSFWWTKVPLLVILAIVGEAFVMEGVRSMRGSATPKSVEVSAKLRAVDVWGTEATTAFHIEVTVVLDWDESLQLQFTLRLPDGTPIDNDRYHREFIAGKAPPEFLDNPQVCNHGQSGPFKVAFLVPSAEFGDPPNPPVEGLVLLYESVPSGIASGFVPLVRRKPGS